MPSHTTTIRVRYADTDKMGIVYYAKYLEYFEVARTEMLRAIGLPYSEIEERGYELPVVSASLKYHKGAHYDDELRVTASLILADSPRMMINYEVRRATDDEFIMEGETTLVFVDQKTGKPARPPIFYLEAVGRAT